MLIEHLAQWHMEEHMYMLGCLHRKTQVKQRWTIK